MNTTKLNSTPILGQRTFLSVATLALVFGVPMPSFADRTVSASYALSADEDWRNDGVVTIADGVTVDLNGYTIFTGGLAGKGGFTSSVANPKTFDLTTKQTDNSRVKAYKGGTDQTLGTLSEFTIDAAWRLFGDYDEYDMHTHKRGITAWEEGSAVDVVYKFDTETVINCYKIYPTTEDTYLQRAPKSWKFFASKTGDADSWVELDSQTDFATWEKGKSQSFAFFNTTAYKFYRLHVTDINSTANLELFKLEYGRIQNQVRLDLSKGSNFSAAENKATGTASFVINGGTVAIDGGTIAHTVDLSGLGKVTLDGILDLAGAGLKVHSLDGAGRIITSDSAVFANLTSADDVSRIYASTNGVRAPMAGESAGTSDGSKYPPERAFDDDPNTFLYAGFKPTADNPLSIDYNFGEATRINKYRIYPYTSNNTLTYATDWTFEGSNDGETWTVLDSQSGQIMVKKVWLEYTLAVPASYSRYRFKVLKTNSDTQMLNGIGKLEYGYGADNTISVSTDGLATTDLSSITVDSAITVEHAEDKITLTENLTLDSGIAITGTIDLNGHQLTVSSLTGGGTVTDTATLADLTTTQTDGSRVKSYLNGEEKAFGTQPAWHAFADYASYNQTVQRVIDTTASWPKDIDYTFDEPVAIDAFRLKLGSAGSAPNRAPKSIRFYGKSGEEYEELGAWTSETGWKASEERQYVFSNPKQYSTYRIRFESSNDGKDILEFFRLEYCNRATGGKLCVNVPAGVTEENSTVTIEGNARLVKDGEGTLKVAKAGQTYAGGTEVRNGTLMIGAAASNLFGADGMDIDVLEGGTLDFATKEALFATYFYNLNGGALRSSVNMSADNEKRPQRARLMANSWIHAEKNFYFGLKSGTDSTFLDLGGYTLNIATASSYFTRIYNTTVTNGTISVTNSGCVIISYTTVSGVSLVHNSPVYLAEDNSIHLVNYESLWNANNAVYSLRAKNGQSFKVHGTFTPVGDYWYATTMMTGSTIDLSRRATPLASESSSAYADNALAFEANAMVTVKVGSKKSPLISWTSATKPANIDTVKFVCADADRKYSLAVKDDGLYALGPGLIIMVK